jgi:hypothetical protein
VRGLRERAKDVGDLVEPASLFAGGGEDLAQRWADGIHVSIRLEEHKLCLLVLIGVRADGRKELVALTDGYRESTESWADLLRDAARRGMRAPVLAIGDGALGFWGAHRGGRARARPPGCPGRWSPKCAVNAVTASRAWARSSAVRKCSGSRSYSSTRSAGVVIGMIAKRVDRVVSVVTMAAVVRAAY